MVKGRGVGVSDPGAGSTTWSAIALEGFVAWRVSSRLALVGGAGGGLLVDRGNFTIDGVGIVHALPPFAAEFSLGAELRL